MLSVRKSAILVTTLDPTDAHLTANSSTDGFAQTTCVRQSVLMDWWLAGSSATMATTLLVTVVTSARLRMDGNVLKITLALASVAISWSSVKKSAISVTTLVSTDAMLTVRLQMGGCVQTTHAKLSALMD